jgi:D-threo-aldose 1-dehydrogenase
MLTRFVTDTDVDVVLVAGRYTLLDQSAVDTLLPAALSRGVSVIVGGVFNSGLLAEPGADATYDYRVASGPLIARARRDALRLRTLDIPAALWGALAAADDPERNARK